VNGIITDENGFLYREVSPCTRCIRRIVKVDGTEQAPRTGQGGA
jgi:deoxycytidylate deaminase